MIDTRKQPGRGGWPTPAAWIRRRFLTGLVILLPTVLTGWILYQVFRSVDSVLRPIVTRYPILDIPGLGVLAVVLIVLGVGIFAGNLLGRRIIAGIETVLARIPLVNRMYITLKQMSEIFLREQRTAFRRAVVIEYPRRGIYSIGFVTSVWTLRDVSGAQRLFLNIFLPTTPNPTSGLFLMVPEEDAVTMDCSVEEAVKMVISGGAVLPAIPPIEIPVGRAGRPAEPERP